MLIVPPCGRDDYALQVMTCFSGTSASTNLRMMRVAYKSYYLMNLMLVGP